MSFATALALLVGALVAAPWVAHLLRRRKTERVIFPPARLVLTAQPVARQRARLEDRGLFGVRALAVLALAVLGATPFVSCSRLSVGRKSGGSVALALVVDDSLSMQARLDSTTRFGRAKEGARQVLGSLREGDVVALVGAGAPPRVLLAATSDLATVRTAIDALRPGDRSTDLDGALAIAASILRGLPHPDRRVVLLSDLADGSGSDAPLGVNLDIPVWVPLEELRGRVPDCAVLRATRRGVQLQAEVACSHEQDATGRSLQVLAAGKVLASAALETRRRQSVVLGLPEETTSALVARLTGQDPISSDDEAPVTAVSTALQVAVVSDLTESALATGGPPPVEQALAALDEGIVIRPLPVVPDDAEALTPFSLVVLDDPPGLTPEARAAFRSWLERGGVGLLWLGPRAGGAILGASFEPFLLGPVRWVQDAPPGADPTSVQALGEVSEGLLSLA
ncbi:MAG: BatA and WFA domain-containing protein, partial [Myxococcales bacterium]|nr:BatA and WFA domain-containing protein [Polyangiaceae bacterium]MDW8248330.1 BatA and WFA domain-containing protein [Myxococcales bacterium]